MIHHHIQQQTLFIELYRPNQFNCQNQQMVKQLTELLKSVQNDSNIKTIHLSAAGAHFSSGGDLKQLLDLAHLREEEKCQQVALFLKAKYELDLLWASMPQHTICTAQGIIYGGGWGLFHGAKEKRITETARLGMPECKLALLPDAGCVTWFDWLPESLVVLILLSGIDVPAFVAVQQGYARFKKPLNNETQNTWYLFAHEKPIHEIYQNSLGLLDFVEKIILLCQQDKQMFAIENNLKRNNALAMALIWRHFKKHRSGSRLEALQAEQRILTQLICYGEFQTAAQSRLIEKIEFNDWLYRDLRIVSPTVISQFEQKSWSDNAISL